MHSRSLHCSRASASSQRRVPRPLRRDSQARPRTLLFHAMRKLHSLQPHLSRRPFLTAFPSTSVSPSTSFSLLSPVSVPARFPHLLLPGCVAVLLTLAVLLFPPQAASSHAYFSSSFSCPARVFFFFFFFFFRLFLLFLLLPSQRLLTAICPSHGGASHHHSACGSSAGERPPRTSCVPCPDIPCGSCAETQTWFSVIGKPDKRNVHNQMLLSWETKRAHREEIKKDNLQRQRPIPTACQQRHCKSQQFGYSRYTSAVKRREAVGSPQATNT